MLLSLTTLLLSCFQLTTAELKTATPEEVGMSAEILSTMTTSAQELIDDERIVGSITAVVRKGFVVHFEALGWADLEKKVPMKRDSILRFYSMSKPITSVAMMALVEDEEIALDDPLSDVFSGFEEVEVSADGRTLKRTEPLNRPITIRDLLRHTSGLTYGIFGNTDVDKRYREARLLQASSLMAMIEGLETIPLLFQPGERWQYGLSTDVLGAVVEEVSGQAFDTFLQGRIFDPLGMEDTGFFVPEEKLGRLATNYAPSRGEGWQVVDPPDASSQFASKPALLSGGGGLVSTAEDYIRFCLMLLGGGEFDGVRILEEETVEAMTKNQLKKGEGTIGFPGAGFGLGFSVRFKDNGTGPLGEFGWAGAASTSFSISPKDDLAIISLTQQMPSTTILHDKMKDIVYRALEKGEK